MRIWIDRDLGAHPLFQLVVSCRLLCYPYTFDNFIFVGESELMKLRHRGGGKY